MLSVGEALRCEHFASRGTFVETEIAPGLRGEVPAGFFELDGVRHGVRMRSPATGEHTAEVRREAAQRSPQAEQPATRGLVRPFEGLRVLDFGIGGVGPEAARLLAEYGADVIRIESRTYPDFTRTVAGSEMSGSFASSSRSKRSVAVDLKSIEGLDLVRRLASTSDLIVENSHTGAMDALGVGYETVRGLNPRIVMVSSQLMGAHGRWADWTGYGPSARTVGGMTWLWNWESAGDDMPPGSLTIYPDHLGGRVCAVAAVAGLIARERSGSGVHAEVAQVETVVNMLGDLYLKESLQPGSVRPRGNSSERGAPWGVYRCAGDERWCAVTVRDDQDWRRLVGAIGEPEWTRAERYATAAGRMAARDELDRHLETWTSQRSDREVMQILQSAGVPAGYVVYPSDQVSDPHFVERGFPRTVHQPDLREIVLDGPAFRGTGMHDVVVGPAPRLGEHTREVCAELGMSEEEVEKLLVAGVLEVAREAASSPTTTDASRPG